VEEGADGGIAADVLEGVVVVVDGVEKVEEMG
jgi:hypothetical protein